MIPTLHSLAIARMIAFAGAIIQHRNTQQRRRSKATTHSLQVQAATTATTLYLPLAPLAMEWKGNTSKIASTDITKKYTATTVQQQQQQSSLHARSSCVVFASHHSIGNNESMNQ
jgi:hypothetical protein